jgi:hypothetical protein
MKKCTLALVVAFTFLSSQATAQFNDPDERMRWFNLQRLAVEAREIEACQVLDLAEQRYRAAYYRAAGELAAAVEDYISKYPSNRWKQETPEAYRYRVWSVALDVGREKARSVKAINKSVCELLTIR